MDVIDGQATICNEIYEDIKNPNIIFGCVGGGGLMSGISKYSKIFNPDCKIFGVETDTADSMNQSLLENKIVYIDNIDTFVDGASVSRVGKNTFNMLNKYLDNIILSCNGHLSTMILDLYTEDGIIVEPAGALGLAGLDIYSKSNNLKNKNVVVIISGGNND